MSVIPSTNYSAVSSSSSSSIHPARGRQRRPKETNKQNTQLLHVLIWPVIAGSTTTTTRLWTLGSIWGIRANEGDRHNKSPLKSRRRKYVVAQHLTMDNTMGCVWTSYTFSGNKEKTDGHANGRTHFTPYIPLRFHINFTSLPLFIVILFVSPLFSSFTTSVHFNRPWCPEKRYNQTKQLH